MATHAIIHSFNIILNIQCHTATDHAIYEEVEAYNKHRPVLIFGALADQVVSSLLESYPNLFYSCPTGTHDHMHEA